MSTSESPRSRRPADILLAVAGLAQLAAAFTPAAHVRLRGAISFLRLPNAGLAFVALGVIAALLAFAPRGWWRVIPALASAALCAVVYARLRWEPSGGFADPLLRHLVRPSWGFVPMAAAVILALVAGLSSTARQTVRYDAATPVR
jgi:hypothetical protein